MTGTQNCSLKPPDYSGVEIVSLSPAAGVADYNAAVVIAKAEAEMVRETQQDLGITPVCVEFREHMLTP